MCFFLPVVMAAPSFALSQAAPATGSAIVLHAARLVEIDTGKVVVPGEVLVQGERIAEVGSTVKRPAGAQIIDLGDTTLLPGLIDAHIHLFLHPGAEDLQTVQESVPKSRSAVKPAIRSSRAATRAAIVRCGTDS